jgi:RHS repeat-associated protein
MVRASETGIQKGLIAMRIRDISIGLTALAVGSAACVAQTPVLGSIEAPYANVQNTVQIGNHLWGPGSVPYGPVGTPLVLSGADLGDTGTVQFVAYKNGSPDPSLTPVAASPSIWGPTMIIVPVPAGAYTGMVQVKVEGKTSNALPFIVTPGQYLAACPAGPTPSQLQIVTTSLHDGTVGQGYSITLGATGGTQAYSWTLANGALPAGLSLNASSGVLSGTPSSSVSQASLTFEVTDQSSPRQTNQAVLDLTIEPAQMNAANVYSYSANYDGNGNVINSSDAIDNNSGSIMGSWTYNYDAFNRLESGQATAGAWSGQNLCWAYDSYGNRTAQSMQSTDCPSPSLESTLQTTEAYNSSNQISSGLVTYDPSGAGYVIADATTGNSYLYDAEGRVCAVKNAAIPGMPLYTGYIYDAEGNRVAKGSITSWSCDPTANGFMFTENYVLGPSGEELSMFDGGNNWQRTNVYAAGKLVGTYDVAGLHFHLEDPLGTRRMQLSGNPSFLGVPETDIQSWPYGDQPYSFPDQFAPASADDATPLHFTGKERDAESGNDYFGARYYASSMGRFMSPDWSEEPDPTPYADLDNPQTLNLYSYVTNNPLTLHDATGHYHCDPDYSTTNANGDMVVHAGACHFDWSDFAYMAVAEGHHFIPKQVWQDIDQASNAWKVLNKATTGALKGKGKILNRWNRLHRSVNRQTEEVVEKLEKDLGKSVEDFNKGDFQELQGRLERAGGDIETFNTRMEALEPEARTLGEAIGEALEEVFPAAASAVEATAPVAEDAAAGAAAVE